LHMRHARHPRRWQPHRSRLRRPENSGDGRPRLPEGPVACAPHLS
jgi:hypothetical protein